MNRRRLLPPPCAVVSLALVASLRPAEAALAPESPELRVDGREVSFASCPLVAAAPNGAFEVVWSNLDFVASSHSRAWSRHFSWQGMPSETARMLAVTTATPSELITLPGGGWRALWQRRTSIDASTSWSTSLFGDFGGPLSPFARLRDTPHGSLLSIRPAGGFVVAWPLQRAGRFELQAFDARGRKVGGRQRLNTTRLVSPGKVGFVHGPDGEFLAVFSGMVKGGGGALASVLFARPYSKEGEPLGRERIVAATPVDDPDFAAIPGFAAAAFGDGRIALAWWTSHFGIQNVYLQVLSASGPSSSPPTVVATGDVESVAAYLQAVAASDNGGVAVLWQEESASCPAPGSQCDHLVARHFDGSGSPDGEKVAVDTTAAGRFDRAVCGSLSAAGTHFVASWLGWDADTNEYVVFARRFAATTP